VVVDRWQVDETYVKVAGQWRYVFRTIDQFGQVIDVFVSHARCEGCPPVLGAALGATRIAPVEVVIDQAATYPVVLEELLPTPGIAPIGMPTTGSSAITAG
jgi:IS6 family transposase